MPSAKTYNPLEAGVLLAIVGAPGFGKSTFVRSSLPYGKLFVVATLPREIVTYAGTDTEYELVDETEGWAPALGKYDATAYVRLMKILYALRTRKDIRTVALDPMSRAVLFAANVTMAGHGVNDWSQIEEKARYTFWQAVKAKTLELCDALEGLRASGKNVIATFHLDVREQEGMGQPQEKIEGGLKKLHWEQGFTPDVIGSVRDTIAGRFDFFSFAERDISADGSAKYWLRVAPSQRAWAKSALPIFDGKQRVPLEFKSIHEAMTTYLAKKQ